MDSFESVEPTPFERLNHRLVETEAKLRLADEEIFYMLAYVRQMEARLGVSDKERYKLVLNPAEKNGVGIKRG